MTFIDSRALLLPILLSAPALYAEEPNTTSGPSLTVEGKSDHYTCIIEHYQNKVLNSVRQLSVQASDVQTTGGEGQVNWRVTRANGIISIAVTNPNGQVLSVSETTDRNPTRVIVASDILTCNHAGSDDYLYINPNSYDRKIKNLSMEIEILNLTDRYERRVGESAPDYKSRVMIDLGRWIKLADKRVVSDGTLGAKEKIVGALNDMDDKAFLDIFADPRHHKAKFRDFIIKVLE